MVVDVVVVLIDEVVEVPDIEEALREVERDNITTKKLAQSGPEEKRIFRKTTFRVSQA